MSPFSNVSTRRLPPSRQHSLSSITVDKDDDDDPSCTTNSTTRRTPDKVMLVMGGVEFIENAHLLSCCSPSYFERQIQSALQEGRELRWDYPTKSAQEWDFVRQLLWPFATAQITLRNMRMVLPWLQDFSITRGLDHCDRIYQEEVLSQCLVLMEPSPVGPTTTMANLKTYQHKLCVVLDALVTTWQFDLVQSKQSFLPILQTVLQDHPLWWTRDHCRQLGTLLHHHSECWHPLANAIGVHLKEYPHSLFATSISNTNSNASSAATEFGDKLYNAIQTKQVVSHLSPVEQKALNWWTGIKGSPGRPIQKKESTDSSFEKDELDIGKHGGETASILLVADETEHNTDISNPPSKTNKSNWWVGLKEGTLFGRGGVQKSQDGEEADNHNNNIHDETTSIVLNTSHDEQDDESPQKQDKKSNLQKQQQQQGVSRKSSLRLLSEHEDFEFGDALLGLSAPSHQD